MRQCQSGQPVLSSPKITLIVPLLIVLLCGLLHVRSVWADDDEQPPAPTGPASAFVQVQSLKRETLVPTIRTYGQAIADPTRTLSVTTQTGGQVTQLMVEAGQWVHKGQKLLVLTLDPKTRLAYQKAQTQLNVAEQDLKQKQYLFARQMATKQELVLAGQAVSDARKTLLAQRKLGAGEAVHVIRANEDALILTMPVSVGTLVSPGGLLVTMSSRHALLLRLGIEPEDARRVTSGMTVRYTPVFKRVVDHQPQRSARVLRVDGQINPATRLLDVVAQPERMTGPDGSAASDDLIAGMTVMAQIELPSQTGLVVPTDAVLDIAHSHAHLFVVKDGHALSVPVHPELRVGEHTLVAPVKPGSLQVGDEIVVVGQYVLTPGMGVRTASPSDGTGTGQ